MLVSFTVHLVADALVRGELVGHVEALDGSAHTVVRGVDELIRFLQEHTGATEAAATAPSDAPLAVDSD